MMILKETKPNADVFKQPKSGTRDADDGYATASPRR
jgi:hypothetical protein